VQKHGKKGAVMSGMRLELGLFAWIVGVAVLAPQARAAAEAEAPVESVQLQEVVVTAERREEKQQSVPISLTVLSGAQLDRSHASDLATATAFVPNLSYQTSIADPTDITFSVRGIQTPGTELVQDSAVPLYIDGVYIARTAGSNEATVDMDRLEVLRGPQGTLFGRNTVGGAVSITTRKPTDKLEGSVQFDGGNYDTRNFTGVVNLPVSDRAALRVVYQHQEHGDYQEGDGFGFNSLKENYVRASLRFDISEQWQLLLGGDYTGARADAPLSKLGYYDAASPFNALLPALNGAPGDLLSNYVNRGNYRQGFSEFLPNTTIEEAGGTATVNGHLGEVSVRSISSYRMTKDSRPVDLDGTPYPLINVPLQPVDVHQLSEELQAFGTALDDRLSWITGLYYFHESGFQASGTQVLAPLNPVISLVDYNATNVSSAVFAQSSYKLTDALKVTAGARYTVDERKIVYHDQNILPDGTSQCLLAPTVLQPGTVCDGPGSVRFHYVPWTVGLDYQLDPDILLYAKTSQSYRSGGFSQSTTPVLGNLNTVNPEKVISPEVGFKTELLDRRLRLNGALFYAKYENIQTQIDVPGPGGIPVAMQENVGAGRMYGGELEATAIVAGRLTLNAGLGLLNSRYTAGPYTGTRFLNAPAATFNVGAAYPMDFSVGRLTLSADYGYKSDQWYVAPNSNPQVNPSLQQPGYGLLNGQAKFNLNSSGLWFSLWGKNITQKQYSTRALDLTATAIGAVIYLPGPPRTYGASIGYDF
jgi:iron complex outermembrane receptor protein